MKHFFSLVIISALLAASCKSKTEDDSNSTYFPALSFIKSQIAHVDTSVYRIIKVVKTNNGTDTVFIKREQFAAEAKDFLSLPDITTKELKDDYVETKQYDPELQQVSLMYLPKDKEDDNELMQENIIIKPQPDGDKVTAIFADQVMSDNGDDLVQKKLFWEVDKRFRIVTITQKQNEPPQTQTVEVIWN